LIIPNNKVLYIKIRDKEVTYFTGVEVSNTGTGWHIPSEYKLDPLTEQVVDFSINIDFFIGDI